MELRIKAARTTKDIDLTMRSGLSSGEKKDDKKNLAVLEKLQEAAAFSSDDFFVYTIGEPIADLDAAPYGGARFPVEARLDGRVFVGFHLDVGIGDAVMEPLEVIEGRDWLGFAGIASPSLYMIPREQQFAEKLHAYTLPRQGAANSRVTRPCRHGSVDSIPAPCPRRRFVRRFVSRLIVGELTQCQNRYRAPRLIGRNRMRRLLASASYLVNWKMRSLAYETSWKQSAMNSQPCKAFAVTTICLLPRLNVMSSTLGRGLRNGEVRFRP